MTQRALLYSDGELDSYLASLILDRYNIKYSLIDLRNFKSSDVEAPRLVTDLGRFSSLESIIDYAKTFGRHEDLSYFKELIF